MSKATLTLIDEAQAVEMMDHEVEAAIFKGAGLNDLRGPSDAFTVEAIRAMWWQDFRSETLRDWLWSAMEKLDREGGA